MKRVRIALLLLLLALAVPVGLLVQRALQSAELERRVRHEAIADRVFDEMERALSRFLEREEARPAADYRFYSWLDEQTTAPTDQIAAIRSPLSRVQPEDFVLLHFQVDPDGSVHTPLRPRDIGLAERRGDWPASNVDQARLAHALDTLEREVTPFWRSARARHDLLEAPSADLAHGNPAPGPARAGSAARLAELETRPDESPSITDARPGKQEPRIEEQLADRDARVEVQTASKDDALENERANAYDVLQSLNRGAEQRRARKQVITETPRSKAFEPARAARPAQEGESASPPSLGRLPATAPYQVGRSAPMSANTQEIDEATATIAKKVDKKSKQEQPVRIILEPMVGQALVGDRLMLYRTVLVDSRGFRQGVLLDRRALGAWLRGEVLGGGPLSGAVQVTFDAARSLPATSEGYYVSAHTFAEPFGGLTVQLGVPPVRGTGSDASIYMLAGLLVVVTLAGLAAIHRMTSVVVQFAERRNNFVAAVSHELKTPLTAIRMYGEMLRDGLVASEGKRDEYHQAISDESERLSRLIDNVLEFSRLEKGGREMRLVVGSPADALRDVAERLRPHILREGFELRVEIDDPLPSVRFDRDALVQVVFNLVDNALKYSSSSARKEIVLSCTRDDADRVVVSVRDHGPGVPRRELRRIFDSFYRVEDELTRSAKGSGIGLALVKELGEAMGAIVRGENAKGGGLRVALSFDPVRASC